jgi:myosin-18
LRAFNRGRRHFQAKTEEQVATDRAFLEAEKVWLVHKEGFAAGRLLKDAEAPAAEGKVGVQVDYNGDVIEVSPPRRKKSSQNF